MLGSLAVSRPVVVALGSLAASRPVVVARQVAGSR